jgi:predicted Zn-dependent protease with MMP-like domain
MSTESDTATDACERAWDLLQSGSAREAARLLDRALRSPGLRPDDEADLRHLLGQAHEGLGDDGGMVREWLAVRRLDEGLDPPRSRILPEEFERYADAALRELPAGLRGRLRDVAIIIDERPSEDMVRDGIDPRLLGLYSGVPYPDQSMLGAAAFPEVIYLFQRNLEAEVADDRALAEQIRITVVHETAHYFGMSDEELARLGLG